MTRQLDPPFRRLVFEALVLVGAALLVFEVVQHDVDVEDTGVFRALYVQHRLDEILAGVATLLIGLLWITALRLRALRHAAQSVTAQAAAFAGILTAIPDVVVLADRGGHLMANGAASRLFGLPEAQVVRMVAGQVMAGARIRDKEGRILAPDQGVIAAALGGRTSTLDVRVLDRLTGTDVEMHVVAAPLSLGHPGDAAVMVGTDVTERAKAQAALVELNARLAQRDREHLQLVRIVGHDIGNALTPIRLQLGILRRKEPGMAGLPILERSARQIDLLVRDLADVAKIEGDALVVKPQGVDASSLGRAAVAGYSELAASYGQTLRYEGPVDGSLTVQADPERFGQVLNNLLSNAVKFTRDGGSITLRVVRDGGVCHFRVEDSGVGLTGEQMARLFVPFGQVHEPSQARERGTGLGLYISRGIMERHHGSLTVESDGPGKGSVFTATLPLAEDANPT